MCISVKPKVKSHEWTVKISILFYCVQGNTDSSWAGYLSTEEAVSRGTWSVANARKGLQNHSWVGFLSEHYLHILGKLQSMWCCVEPTYCDDPWLCSAVPLQVDCMQRWAEPSTWSLAPGQAGLRLFSLAPHSVSFLVASYTSWFGFPLFFAYTTPHIHSAFLTPLSYRLQIDLLCFCLIFQ